MTHLPLNSVLESDKPFWAETCQTEGKKKTIPWGTQKRLQLELSGKVTTDRQGGL